MVSAINSLREVHMGKALKSFLAEKRPDLYKLQGIATELGFKDRNSVYDLYKRKAWTLAQLFKVSDMLGVIPEELLFGEKSQNKADRSPISENMDEIRRHLALIERAVPLHK